MLNANSLESKQKSNHKTKQRGMEGTWLQLLRSCTLHCCVVPDFKGVEIKSETEQESKLNEDEVEKDRNN